MSSMTCMITLFCPWLVNRGNCWRFSVTQNLLQSSSRKPRAPRLTVLMTMVMLCRRQMCNKSFLESSQTSCNLLMHWLLLQVSNQDTDWTGLLHLINFYKSRRFDPKIGLPRQYHMQ